MWIRKGVNGKSMKWSGKKRDSEKLRLGKAKIKFASQESGGDRFTEE
jgi:hypothetical protein